MTSAWQTKSLGEVLVKTETVDPTRRPNEEFVYIDVSSVSNETLSIQEVQRLKGADAPSRARKQVRVNDVLFATIRPTLRRIAIVPKELDGQVCSTGYFVLRPKPEVDPKFAYYFLQTEEFMSAMESLQKGASYPAVTDGDVRSQSLAFPSLSEQKRIVAILDEAFEGIATVKANAEKNLQNAKALFEGYLDSTMIGLCDGRLMKPLGEICRTAAGGTPLKSKREYYEGGAIPWLLSGEVAQGEITKAESYITQAGLDGSSAKLFPPNTVLVAMYGATAGQVGILRIEAATNQAVCGIFPNEKYLPEFLFYFFLHSKKALVAKAVGNAQPNISQEKIRGTLFPVLPVTDQRSVVERLRSVRDEACGLESLYQQKLSALDDLKKSLLHHAFSGQL